MAVTIDAVSVVVPHHGDPEPTREVVRRLRTQRTDARVQIIVSDDASPTPFPVGPGYEVVRRETNGGFGAAVNSGLARVEHDVLLVLNSDVEIGADFLQTLLTGASPWWPAMVAPRVMHPSGEAIVARSWPTVGQQMCEWFEPFARFHGRDWLERSIGNDVTAHRATGPTLTDWLIGVCLLLPTQQVREVGGFDERYFMNCEEIDLQRRLHEECGLPAVLLAEPQLRHASGGSSDPARRAGWLTDARFRYHDKWVGNSSLRWGLVATTSANFAWNLGRRVAGRPTQPVKSLGRQRDLVAHGWATRQGAGPR